MSVIAIRESRYPPASADEGLDLTRAIWADMPRLDGYLEHEIVQDLDDPGHLFVISRWRTRIAAAAALAHRSHPQTRRVDTLVIEPHRRSIGVSR